MSEATLLSKVTMLASGTWPFLLVSLLFLSLHHGPSHGFTLKNCTIAYSENNSDVSVSCRQHGISAIPDDIPRNAASLDLGSNQILAITRTDLRGLSKLRTAQVEYNFISHIDDGAFADLGELNSLFLDENRLRNLTDNMFLGLSRLVFLSLCTNQISFVSPGAFQPLVSIQWVELGSNQLHQITDIAPILKFPFLTYLGIGYNKFTSFQSDDLPLNISNIKMLELSMNPLRTFSITKDIFPHLKSLDFSKCSYDIDWNVPNKTFLSSLTSLALSGCYISFETYSAMLQTAASLQQLSLLFMEKFIDDGLIDVACQTPSLRSLDAILNKIGFVDDNLLWSCSQLNELKLSHNDLSGMSEHALQNTRQLKLLNLESNQLKKVPLAVRGLARLESLNLHANFISELSCLDFQNLTSITALNLKRNLMSSLQECVFQNLNNLKELDIGENIFCTIESSLKGSLQKLETLNMHNNRFLQLMQGTFQNLLSLSSLDLESDSYYNVYGGTFEGLDHLKTLSLSLSVYEKATFRGLQHLETLSLHLTFNWKPNSLQQNFEPSFSDLVNLKTLVLKTYDTYSADVSPDLLSGLKSLESFKTEKFFTRSLHPDTFKYTPQLRRLEIIQSGLTHLAPEVFWPIPNLKELDLSNNKLSSLDFLSRANLPKLRWLKLSNNELSIINETTFQSLPALTYLDLSDNPLTCECSNSGFNQWILNNNQTQVVNGHQYPCAFPVSQKGNMFLDFDVRLCWVDSSFLCFVSSSCLVMLTLLASFVYHFLRLHIIYTYYLLLAFLYDKTRSKKGTPDSYDAFVSYNIHDEAWVCSELLPILEGQQGWKLCLHHRDFVPGKPIIENITEAIYSCRKTICVISRHYLQSEWCSREIQMASFRLFDEHKDVLIMLFLEDIPVQQLSPYHQMRGLVKRCTYLSWPQATQHSGVFWQNVERALGAAESPTDNSLLRV
ncbi:toll-like receptor 13 isoform X1 [Melanotaenia boesemani]|uniref:toll-like receptor 13 isoform X1 n=1 Tax=Melanotaenia boesemani TaxID=1250792 RepID=UPI001C049B41|nr:toll-like receptor 13 isoform X1 [Melanotaenia boesemani]